MSLTQHSLEARELGLCAWVCFWAELVVLAALAVLGASFASGDAAPGDGLCGVGLALAAAALAFLRLKARFDGGAGSWAGFLLVDDMPNLVLAIVVFVLLALAGLVAAAGSDHGGLHDAGVGLFAVSGVLVFLSMKRVFDNLDRRR